MKRQDPAKWIFGLIPALFVYSCSETADVSNAKPGNPNVILILADDMGYGDLGCFGQKKFSTPHIDQMAEEGLMLTQFYSGSAVCAPARASLLTGKHQGYASVRAFNPDTAQWVRDDEYTLGELFQDAGYVTGAIGKWGVGHPQPLDDPQRKGFDYFYGHVDMFHAHNFYPEFLYENQKRIMLGNVQMEIDGKNPWADDRGEGMGVATLRNKYTHDLFDEKALEFIESNKAKPFFLYLPFTLPHINTEAWNYMGDGMEVPYEAYNEFRNSGWPRADRGYAAMIRNIDNSVGKILEKLKESGIDQNTLVIFTSDNGANNSGGFRREFFESNGIYRGGKRDLYEGGIRVPFIARWPGVVPEGTVSDHQFAFWDFLATFSEMVDVAVPDKINGLSFLPTLKGLEQEKVHEYLYWEFYNINFARQGGIQAIRKGDWKALKLNISSVELQEVFELYNLKDDPSESVNLAGKHPELERELKDLFMSARVEFDKLPLFTK